MTENATVTQKAPTYAPVATTDVDIKTQPRIQKGLFHISALLDPPDILAIVK